MKKNIISIIYLYPILLLIILLTSNKLIAQDVIMSWDFETINNNNVIEASTNIADTLEGNFRIVKGVKGNGLYLDSFTTRVVRGNKYIKKPNSEFTIEAWVALGEYPLNWCPVITTESNEVKGYRLMIGPYGQVSFQTAISEQWVSCTSANEVVPLRKWVHISCTYKAKEKMVLFINGIQIAEVSIKDSLTFPRKSDCILGMVATPLRPSNTIRTWGTMETYFGLDGIIDEIKVLNSVLSAKRIKTDFLEYTPGDPDIPNRKLPVVENHPNHFGAYYTKLKYCAEWDNVWPVDNDPDIVVFFDNNPSKMIFWRGTRYGPSWVTENENWMTDQSLETWNNGKKDTEGCFEHMQDRHCRFSHVRIIENNEARVVVHWRYAPVSSHNHTWMPDPKTGWECWVDEYYYIYPDGSAIRKVSWNKGSTGKRVQFQETLPITQPGQTTNDLIENNYVTLSDYNHNRRTVSLDENINSSNSTGDYTIQRINLRSQFKPFICFEPGNSMWLRKIGGGYNHFPVNQARSDGRWAKVLDRPTHILSSPCSNPIIHNSGNRQYWIGLYGMNNMDIGKLEAFGRSWAYPPKLIIENKGFISYGYDKTQRCYQIEKNMKSANSLHLLLQGSTNSPIINPVIIIKNWNNKNAKIFINGKESKNIKRGINHQLSGDDLIIFIPLNEKQLIKIRIEK